jgi:hypothetical protein
VDGDEVGLDPAVDLGRDRRGLARLAVHRRGLPPADERPAGPLDGVDVDAEHLGDVLVGTAAVGMGGVGEQEDAGVPDRLGRRHAVARQVVQARPLVVGQVDCELAARGAGHGYASVSEGRSSRKIILAWTV